MAMTQKITKKDITELLSPNTVLNKSVILVTTIADKDIVFETSHAVSILDILAIAEDNSSWFNDFKT
ncbi:hypothetical protein B4146_2276 [Bacillus subtilis]|uniref:Uncharacterized protein n=1 Tax=Bacillus subtilis TaxID=1423 RepID=A0AAP1E1F6_BACIU|nr:hypothetical protein B4146_2276 [Bacillus subtilis]KZD91355.1 hypothetical protein B4122_1997 [Bacillus subtilis]